LSKNSTISGECQTRAFKLKNALRKELKERFVGTEDRKFIDNRSGPYHSINMDKLPKGMELQASIEVEIEKPDL
jgi:hypothetical protein